MGGNARVFAANFCTGSGVSAKSLRMRRLFGADGRLLLVAMDHAGFMGPQAGLDLPTMATVVAAGAEIANPAITASVRFVTGV